MNRVRDKLTGRDFPVDIEKNKNEQSTAMVTRGADVPLQVDLLIRQATTHENLCQCYIGW